MLQRSSLGSCPLKAEPSSFEESQLGQIKDETRSHYPKAGMRGILQMMAQRRLRILRRRLAVHVGHRPERRLRRRTSIKQPGHLLADRQRVQRGQFGKNIVRMLVIDQRLSMISFARLKELGKTRDAARSATPPKTSAGRAVSPTTADAVP